MTASNPFLRIATAASELVGSVVKLGESVAVRVTGKEREAIQSELRQAQAVGQFTVLMATAKAKSAVADLLPKPTPSVENESNEPTGDPEPAAKEVRELLVAPSAIADYDSLTAAQIVAQLSDLSAEERSEILAYEQANRSRNSILKEISRLA